MTRHPSVTLVPNKKGRAGFPFLLPTSRVLWWGWGIMKNIDIKSLIIGALLTSTIFLGVAATSPTDKWDKGQLWQVSSYHELKNKTQGWEPLAVETSDGKTRYYYRRRIK